MYPLFIRRRASSPSDFFPLRNHGTVFAVQLCYTVITAAGIGAALPRAACDGTSSYCDGELYFTRAREALALSESFAAAYLAALGDFSDLPVQLIHRDPNPGNILAAGECITGFVDFDLSQRSIRLFDPCYAATGVLVESGSEYSDADMARWISLWHEILDGYDAAVGLTGTEKRAAKYVLLAVQFICVGYFTQHEKFADLARTNIRMTQAILVHWDHL